MTGLIEERDGPPFHLKGPEISDSFGKLAFRASPIGIRYVPTPGLQKGVSHNVWLDLESLHLVTTLVTYPPRVGFDVQ